MKNLWTPWRMSYILGQEKKIQGCIFEAAGEVRFAKEALMLHRNRHTVVLLNRFPYANGHLLVAPISHVGELSDLNIEESGAVMEMIKLCTVILKKHLKPAGFNIGLNIGKVAGAGIDDHLHFHIIPRWPDDQNFMTVIGEIRTIPEHIDNTFEQLLPDFNLISAV